MKNTLISLLLLIFLMILSCQQPDSGTNLYREWDLRISNDEGEWIPARMAFEKTETTPRLNIINARDTIQLDPSKTVDDTLFYHFIDYNAEIAFSPDGKNALAGYWIPLEDEPLIKRQLRAVPAESTPGPTPAADLTGEWRTRVSLPTRGFDAILSLEQNDHTLYGTMRTRSGDYQYLEGEVRGQDFYMSTFSGNSLFYIEGEIKNDTLTGRIHGVKSSDRTIEAVRDPDFDLPDAASLTKVINDEPFRLDLKDEKGKQHNFSDLTGGHVSVISIFGTWCPNCVEEVDYFNEIKEDFPEVQFLFVAFETTDNEDEQQRRVQGFKDRKTIDMTFLIGGRLGEENVRSKFPMIDHFGAYPTTFVLDKKGEIRTVHTGFNGPATGLLFDQYKKETENLLQSLIEE